MAKRPKAAPKPKAEKPKVAPPAPPVEAAKPQGSDPTDPGGPHPLDDAPEPPTDADVEASTLALAPRAKGVAAAHVHEGVRFSTPTKGAGHAPVIPRWGLVGAVSEGDPFTFLSFAGSMEDARTRKHHEPYASYAVVAIVQFVEVSGPAGAAIGLRDGIDGVQSH